MTVNKELGSMKSRSVRLHTSTLDKLNEEAIGRGIGITVLIRTILEERYSPIFTGENSE